MTWEIVPISVEPRCSRPPAPRDWPEVAAEFEDVAIEGRVAEKGDLGLGDLLAVVDQLGALDLIVLAVEHDEVRLIAGQEPLLREVPQLHWRVRQNVVGRGLEPVHLDGDRIVGQDRIERVEARGDVPELRARGRQQIELNRLGLSPDYVHVGARPADVPAARAVRTDLQVGVLDGVLHLHAVRAVRGDLPGVGIGMVDVEGFAAGVGGGDIRHVGCEVPDEVGARRPDRHLDAHGELMDARDVDLDAEHFVRHLRLDVVGDGALAGGGPAQQTEKRAENKAVIRAHGGLLGT